MAAVADICSYYRNTFPGVQSYTVRIKFRIIVNFIFGNVKKTNGFERIFSRFNFAHGLSFLKIAKLQASHQFTVYQKMQNIQFSKN